MKIKNLGPVFIKIKNLDPVLRSILIVGILWAILALCQVIFLHVVDVQNMKKIYDFNIDKSVNTHEKATATYCLIEQDKQYLVVYRSIILTNIFESWFYRLPGGILQDGQNPAYIAAKKTYEETGVKVSVVRKLKQLADGSIIYLCKTASPIDEKHVNSYSKLLDIANLGWFNPDMDINFSITQFPEQIEYVLEYHETVIDGGK